MPVAPELALYAFSFQWLSLFHSLIRHGASSSPKPHCSMIVQPVAWLRPVYTWQSAGIGPALPPDDGPVRGSDRLAGFLLRAASSAALACAAAAVAASSALLCASLRSFWSAVLGVVAGTSAICAERVLTVVRCWDFRSEIRS